MSIRLARTFALVTALVLSGCAQGFEAPPLTADETAAAAADYQRYCALCHGAERQGYANDQAPSLRSKSLFGTGFPEVHLFTVAYGRRGTPMAGFFNEIGGPLDNPQIYRLIRWLEEQVDVESVDLSPEPLAGDPERGRAVFAERCAICHGEHGEGKVGPAIANPGMLSITPDAFLKYAIFNGRDGTEMQAWNGVLPPSDIDAVVAFLRSHETAWVGGAATLQPPPAPEHYVLNPDGAEPGFELEDDLYVKAADLNRALEQGRRMIVLDTRVTSMWQVAHISGSVPIPYYYDAFDELAQHLPGDGTWIVSYCECPRAAAESVTKKLRAAGFANTAVLWEGIQGWIALGYPVSGGELGQDSP